MGAPAPHHDRGPTWPRLARSFAPTVLLVAYAAEQAAVGRDYRAGSAVAIAVEAAIVGVLVAWPRVRWAAPGLAPLLVAGVLGIFHEPVRADVPAAAGVLALALLAFGVDVGRGVDRAVSAFGRGLTAAIGGFAFVVAVLPAWAWGRLLRRDALRGRRSGRPAWVERARDPRTTERDARALGTTSAAAGSRRTLTGRLTWSVGCVLLLLAANYGIGWGWDQAFPTHPPARTVTDDPLSSSSGAVTGPVPRDPRIDAPAMAAYPWRERYFNDIQRTTGGYWPYTEYRPNDFHSPYLNLRGWVRTSWEPPGDPSRMPTVWMFGGSTTWGEGQRDGHTIASEIARIAAAQGMPLRISNFGERGWTSFQEMVLYEQRLSLQADPDVALFYDGANEVTTQSLLNEAVPSHTLVYAYAKKLFGQTVATQFVEPAATPSPWSDLWGAYSEHSAIHKLVHLFRSERADAAPSPPTTTTPLPPGLTAGQEANNDGNVSNYHTTVQDGIDAGRVYERGKQLILLLSREHHVRPYLFWQPVKDAGAPEQAARAELTAPTINISDALDGHTDTYIDAVHTNEVGARIVAERIWRSIEPGIRHWYATHR